MTEQEARALIPSFPGSVVAEDVIENVEGTDDRAVVASRVVLSYGKCRVSVIDKDGKRRQWRDRTYEEMAAAIRKAAADCLAEATKIPLSPAQLEARRLEEMKRTRERMIAEAPPPSSAEIYAKAHGEMEHDPTTDAEWKAGVDAMLALGAISEADYSAKITERSEWADRCTAREEVEQDHAAGVIDEAEAKRRIRAINKAVR